MFTLHQRWVDDEDMKSHNKVLMNYETKMMDTRKGVIIHEALDSIVQRVKNNINLKESFADLYSSLPVGATMDDMTVWFKKRASTTYKSIYWTMNETLS